MTWESGSTQGTIRQEGLLGWEQAHEHRSRLPSCVRLGTGPFQGRHATLSVTARAAVLINQFEEKSTVELIKKRTFSVFIPRFTVLSATQNMHFYSGPGVSDAGGSWTTV